MYHEQPNLSYYSAQFYYFYVNLQLLPPHPHTHSRQLAITSILVHGQIKEKTRLYSSYSSAIGNLQSNRLKYACTTHICKAIYLAPANMYTDHLVTHSDHHYCKQVLRKPCWNRS